VAAPALGVAAGKRDVDGRAEAVRHGRALHRCDGQLVDREALAHHLDTTEPHEQFAEPVLRDAEDLHVDVDGRARSDADRRAAQTIADPPTDDERAAAMGANRFRHTPDRRESCANVFHRSYDASICRRPRAGCVAWIAAIANHQ
jgi:hypothetical protein